MTSIHYSLELDREVIQLVSYLLSSPGPKPSFPKPPRANPNSVQPSSRSKDQMQVSYVEKNNLEQFGSVPNSQSIRST